MLCKGNLYIDLSIIGYDWFGFVGFFNKECCF